MSGHMARKVLVLAAAAVFLLPANPARSQTSGFPGIEVGQSVRGTLDPGGPSLLENGPFAAYRFRGEAGRRYRADARSSDFDSYLILAHSVGGITEFLREDDDGGDGSDARLRFSIERDGEYVLIVQSWGSGSSGSFELSLDEWVLPPPAAPRPIAIGQVVSGRITEETSVFITDRDDAIPYDLWTFQGRGGEHYRISLESEDFDAYLDFGPMSGGDLMVEESNDDGGEGQNALLRVQLSHDGVFGIRARPLGSSSDHGTYTLRVEPYTPAPPVRRPVEAGAPVTGELGIEDAVLEQGIHFQEWIYRGTAGERVRIRMRSDDFDTYLVLGQDEADGTFREFTSNDDAPDDGLNSMIEFTLPTSGEYVIRARSFAGGATGTYTVEVTREG